MKHKLKTWHWALIITASVLIMLIASIAIWWSIMDVESFSEGWTLIENLVNPPSNDIHYKESYSVSDKKAKKWADKVVANVGHQELTNGELQVYYWMEVYTFLNYNGQYAISQGLDYTQPLDQQTYAEYGGTWQQYFLEEALGSWHEEQALALMAQTNGMTLSTEDQVELDNLRKDLAASVVKAGYSSIDAMLQSDMGAGCSFDDYYSYRSTYTFANTWFSAKSEEALDQITSEDLETYYSQHQTELADKGISKDSGLIYGVRHILVTPPGGAKDSNGNMSYTDEEFERCRQEAQELMDKWLAEGGTEPLFAQYANDYSADPGSNTSGGLYEGLKANTDILKEFVAWYSDSSRKIGDYGLIKTSQGYHIMYLSTMEQEWKAAAREALLSEASKAIVSEATAKHPIEVTYKNIVLSVVDLKNVG